MKIAFVINGLKRISEKNQKVIDECKSDLDFNVELVSTTKRVTAEKLAFKFSLANYDYVIAVGGDGTIHEVVNGLKKNENNFSCLGILPNGSGNDTVKSMKLKISHDDFSQNLKSFRVNSIDLCRLESKSLNKYFINIGDIGFGGQVIETLNKSRGKKSGINSYTFSILRTFFRFDSPKLHLVSDEKNYKGLSLMTVFCNGSLFGNGLIINPDALMNDGQMNITLLGKISIWDYLLNVRKLKRGRKIVHPEVFYWTTKRIQCTVNKGKGSLELDGEFYSSRKFTISIEPNSIQVLNY